MNLFGYKIYKSKLYQHDIIKKRLDGLLDSTYKEYDNDRIKNENISVHGNFNVATTRNFHHRYNLEYLNFLDEYLEVNVRKYLGDIGDYDIKFLRRWINRSDYGSGLKAHTDMFWENNEISYSDIVSHRKFDFTLNYYPKIDFGCGDLVLHNPLFYNHRDETKIENDNNIWGMKSKVNMNINEGDVVMYPYFLPHSVEYSYENKFFDSNISEVSERFAIISFIKIIRR